MYLFVAFAGVRAVGNEGNFTGAYTMSRRGKTVTDLMGVDVEFETGLIYRPIQCFSNIFELGWSSSFGAGKHQVLPPNKTVAAYSFDEARELLRLAYVLTIHKTQGGEYRTVLIPMTLSHFIMLNNKLLYTAVTRAKEKVVPVGEDYAFRSACREKDVTVRDTVLKMLPVASPAEGSA